MIELTNDEQLAFVNLCAAAPAVKTVVEFQEWARTHVTAFFPFGTLLAVLGSLLDELVFIEHMVGVNYPDEFMLDIQRQSKLSDRPVIAKWYQEHEPQVIDESLMAQSLSPFELIEAQKYDLRNLAVHGVIDLQGNKGSYFSFSRIPGPLSERHRQKLKLMVPQLHQVICKLRIGLVGNHLVQPNRALSIREQQILRLVAQGKTNREIAALLVRSERTINNHVHAILSKLGVANRAEAAVRLMQIG